MRTPKDEETLPEISTEQLAEVQGGAGFGDMMPFMMMMMMMQRQAPPPPVVRWATGRASRSESHSRPTSRRVWTRA